MRSYTGYVSIAPSNSKPSPPSMFGKKGVYTLEKRTDHEVKPSPFRDQLLLLGVSFAFGVVGWYLIRPLIGM